MDGKVFTFTFFSMDGRALSGWKGFHFHFLFHGWPYSLWMERFSPSNSFPWMAALFVDGKVFTFSSYSGECSQFFGSCSFVSPSVKFGEACSLQKSHEMSATFSWMSGTGAFTCFLCDNIFTDKKLLVEHLKEYEKLFPCKQCGEFFVSLNDLEIHMKNHSEQKPFPCRVCEKYFTKLCDLKRHRVIHSSEKPFLCNECGERMKRKKALKRHVKLLHNEQRRLRCKQCDAFFLGAAHLQDHIKEIHIELKTDKLKIDGKGREMVQCTVCNKWLAKSYFRNHKRTHLEEKLFLCKLCNKRFTQKANMTVHNLTHTGERPYSCSQCGKSFSRSQTLKMHQNIHTGEKPFKCTLCDKSFQRTSHLRRHHEAHADGRIKLQTGKQYPCNQCRKYLSNPVNLEKHTLAHTNKKSFTCSQCGKCFGKRHHLKSHKKVHTEFNCNQCRKRFQNEKDLRAHQVSHTTKKLYHCSQCDKYYKQKAHLTRHKKSHKENLPTRDISNPLKQFIARLESYQPSEC